MTVVEWANEGLEIASKSGKSIDELIGFLIMAYAMKMLFDNAKSDMTNAEKFEEIFGKSAKNVCDADNNEWWSEEYSQPDADI